MKLALATCLFLAGCNYNDRIGKLEKQNQDLQAAVKKDRNAADYELQAKCAKDSKTWFNENWPADKTTILLTYTNHYNRALNKCFIEVEYHYKLYNESWINDITVWDIYENEKYGNVSVNHMISKPDFHDSETISGCKVYGRECKTVDEFNGLAHPYMNN